MCVSASRGIKTTYIANISKNAPRLSQLLVHMSLRILCLLSVDVSRDLHAQSAHNSYTIGVVAHKPVLEEYFHGR